VALLGAGDAMQCRPRLIRLTALAAALCGWLATAAPVRADVAPLPAPPSPPPARPVTDDYFGTTVTDPYRYFEQLDAPDVQSFFKSRNDYTRAVLERLGEPRKRLFERIAQLDNAGVSVFGVSLDGDWYFYEKREPGVNSERLYVRAAAAGSQERLLLDPDKLETAPGKHVTINYFVPSLDGRFVAYGISEGGSEDAVIHVLDVASGRSLPDAIDRGRYGVASWRTDGRSFYYLRLPKLAPNTPPAEAQLKPVCYLHVLGQNPDRDVAVFGYGVNPSIPFDPTDAPAVLISPASPYALGLVAHGVRNEQTLYAAPAASVDAPNAPWKKIVDVDDDVTGLDVRGSTLYLLTHKDAPAFKVVELRLDRPDFANAPVLVAPSRGVVLQVAVAKDGLYVRSREGGFGRIARIPLAADGTANGPASPVTLPYDGSMNAMTTDPRVDGATFGLTAWTRSLLYDHAAADGRVADTKLKPPAPVDASGYESREVEARSADGTLIPLSLVFKRGLALDGSHPAYLEGYGAYGITLEPYFSTTRIAWMERGGVYAVCHVRGGGWYGEGWHDAGKIATKQHSIDDFVACGRYLVEGRFTSPQHLAGSGTSAGGIVIGGAVTQHPELFAAAIDEVGVSDALRSEFSANGPANIPEFGSVKTPEGFKALYAMDAYQHVVDGKAYPAVMLVTGINDPRVPPWELAKFAARLQTATSSGRPILLRVDYDAGHGFLAASRAQSDQLLSDEYGFLLWQLGDPDFQTIPQRIFNRRS
jgi:prolyl oligopeptidase